MTLYTFGKYKLSATGEPSGSENFSFIFRLGEAYFKSSRSSCP